MLPNRPYAVPARPKLYYILPIDNLASIAASGFLFSDARRIDLGLLHQNIGMPNVKERRLTRQQVTCHPGTYVGHYVPFYFCPRSIMLYIIAMKNHPDLEYRGGQEPIIHLQLDLYDTVQWAESVSARWAFSDRNAADALAEFYKDLKHLDQINWDAVSEDRWADPLIKIGKQAEFLVYEQVPLALVENIGVHNHRLKSQVKAILAHTDHNPVVNSEPTWYY